MIPDFLSSSLACSSCFFGEEHVRWAYYVSALFMLLLPPLSIGAFVLWLRRTSRLMDESQVALTDSGSDGQA